MVSVINLKRNCVSVMKIFWTIICIVSLIYLMDYSMQYFSRLQQPELFKVSMEAEEKSLVAVSPCGLGYENSIWLFETKFNYPTPRALCSVESLSSQMPHWCVRFLINNWEGLHGNNTNKSLAIDLMTISENIRISRLDVNSLLSDTPLRDVLESVKKSDNYVPHLSDLLRLAVMYKYGGIYVDLDMIAIRPLETWKEKYFTRQFREGFIGSTIIKASKPFEKIFFRAMVAARRDYKRTYYPSLLNSFGKTVVSYCWKLGAGIRVMDRQDHLTEKCGDWHILGFNGNGMCHDYKLYVNDTYSVRKQFHHLNSENCTLLHCYSTYRLVVEPKHCYFLE